MIMNNLKVELFLIICIICYQQSFADESCGDWEAYSDEKCFKVIDDTLVNYTDAINTCAHLDNFGSLAIIGSKVEQDFLTNFVFNTKNVADNVWIGIHNTTTVFTTIDNNLALSYTNWSPASPQTDSGYDCVQMIADNALIGKWINVPCARKNAVVCQKMQVWSVARLQKALLDERKSVNNVIQNLVQKNNDLQQKQSLLDATITALKAETQQKQSLMDATITALKAEVQQKQSLMDTTITGLKTEISHNIQNPVPPGFIYVQLPGQSEPKLIWPALNWTDVSATYAGLFFRVIGGSASGFGAEQAENDRYLSAVRYLHTDSFAAQVSVPVTGEWSANVFSGVDQNGWGRYSHNFLLSVGEVRPRNKAIKIWKRN